MNDYFSSFLLPMGKCITLMGTQNNIVYSNAPYITLIIGKWSLAHTVEPKKFSTFQIKINKCNRKRIFGRMRDIVFPRMKKLHVGDYLKSNLLQNEKFASLNVHLHTSFEQNVLQIGRYHARSKFIFYAMEFQFIFTWNVKICIKYLLKIA